ncbi:MAG: twin-arginine translocase subunit TatB [Rhodospirillales bacterium]|nr:twin-arginine translocase subunit TatB [Rhodospirillales bacterium]MSP81139.1 twin-arginine translocase subunit TatB [Rhodospirillales bacterium]
MFDIGWQELLVIGVVALVVIGPKDMPTAIRAVSRWASKARALAREFQQGIDEVVREAELQDVKKNIEDVQNLDLKTEIAKTVDPTGEVTKSLDLSGVEKNLDATARALTYEPSAGAAADGAGRQNEQPDAPGAQPSDSGLARAERTTKPTGTG